MSRRDKGLGGGTSLQKAPLAGIDRVFGRDLRSQGWVVDLPSDNDRDSALAAEGALGDGEPLPAMMWALRARRK